MIPQSQRLMTIVLAPLVTEKSSRLADKSRQFVFKVVKSADKSDIKRAVELMFNVKVDAVKVLNVKGKTKKFGGIQGTRNSWKKAYVTLKEGFDIDFAESNKG